VAHRLCLLPQKLTSEYEKELSRENMAQSIDDRLKAYNTDMLDLWRPVGPPGARGRPSRRRCWRSAPRARYGRRGLRESRKQGKVRFLGVSAHKPEVFRRVLNDYPQFSVILFPYMFLTTAFKGDSLLDLAKQKDVGVIAIKPFAAGATFIGGTPTKFEGKVDTRASSLLKAMLAETRVSAIIRASRS